MKRIFFAMSLCGGLMLARHACAQSTDIARFAAIKETQVRELAKGLTNKPPSMVWSFFDAARANDYQTATNLGVRLELATGHYPDATGHYLDPGDASLSTIIWPPILETLGTVEEFHDLGDKWSHRFAREVIDSIPPGSIYFGGSDAGRFLVSAFSDSQIDGRPFFILTQNQLADGLYLEYLRHLFGRKLYMLSTNDSQKAFNDYYEGFTARYRAGKMKPGEKAEVNANGQLQVSGQTAVMAINGLMVKTLIEKNPNHEFYIEESYAIDWMYPNLSPHGLIMKLSAQPMAGLSPDNVQKDRAYWKKFTGELIGDWITDKTLTKELCDFADKLYLKKNLADFKGDADFIQNEEAQHTFSKLRKSIAGVYAWRAQHAADPDERSRMQQAAELAFRQSFALCPHYADTVSDYANFLASLKRSDEAILLAQTCLRLNQEDETSRNQILTLIRSLRSNQ